MARAVSNGRTPELEQLLEPIPLYTIGNTAPTQSCQETTEEASGGLPSAAARLLEDGQLLEATTSALNGIRMVDGKGSVMFSVPADDYTGVSVQLLSTEEKSDTTQARGMKARLQLYINRQRLEDTGAGSLAIRANSL